MKLGGGLVYVTGPMGGGKSLFAVRTIVSYLLAGKPVVTNVRLLEKGDPMPFSGKPEPHGWDARIARKYARLSRRKRRRIVETLRANYHFITDIGEAPRYRVDGHGEARALFVWDESHNDLNNRNWRERKEAHGTTRGTDALLEWATQLRKLGFVGLLLSQHHENTDVALRRVASWLCRVQNQREHTRGPFGMRLKFLPPLYIASFYSANVPVGGGVRVPIKVQRWLPSWHRHLYDTHDLFHGLGAGYVEDRGDLIVLGRHAAGPTRLPQPRERLESGGPEALPPADELVGQELELEHDQELVVDGELDELEHDQELELESENGGAAVPVDGSELVSVAPDATKSARGDLEPLPASFVRLREVLRERELLASSESVATIGARENGS